MKVHNTFWKAGSAWLWCSTNELPSQLQFDLHLPSKRQTTKLFKASISFTNQSVELAKPKENECNLIALKGKQTFYLWGCFFSSSSIQWRLEAAARSLVGLEGRGCPSPALLVLNSCAHFLKPVLTLSSHPSTKSSLF